MLKKGFKFIIKNKCKSTTELNSTIINYINFVNSHSLLVCYTTKTNIQRYTKLITTAVHY